MRSNGLGLDHGAKTTLLTPSDAFSPIVYASRAMGEIIDKIRRARDSYAPVLITGETGTGKELIARAVHAFSPRHGREFIPFNCGGMTPELIASELFGYRRGAFTGADRDYKGVIRTADGGSLFLDEIGELPLIAQPKLLRFLQEGELHPLGETRPTNVKVRVIAATNCDLQEEVRSGRFRADLYYRLNVFRIHIPPLRVRRQDIRPLVEHFLDRRQREGGEQPLRLSDEAWALLLDYHWPGNVRELENVTYRLAVLAANYEEIGPERVMEEIGVRATPPAAAIVEGKIVIDLHLPYREREKELERLSIINALNESGGNITQAAARLGMCRNGLKNWIKRFEIDLESAAYRTLSK